MILTPSSSTEMLPVQERAAVALAQGRSQVQTARLCDVSDRTIRRWLNNEHFAMLVDAHRARNTAHAAQLLDSLQLEAVAVLQELMRPDQSAATRLRAASLVMGTAADLRTEISTLRRFAQFEEQMVLLELRGDDQ